jgi:hypothetical protein
MRSGQCVLERQRCPMWAKLSRRLPCGSGALYELAPFLSMC